MKKFVYHSLSKDKQQFLQEKSLDSFQQNQISNKHFNYQRKCHTPSIVNHQKKSKSKPKESKEKLSDKKNVYYSIKNFKPETSSSAIIPSPDYNSNIPMTKEVKSSPFKHKYKKQKNPHTGGGSIHYVSHASSSNAKSRLFQNIDVNSSKVAGINNFRHARNLQSQLSHLANISESSIFRHSQNRIDRDRESSLHLVESAKKNTNKSKKHLQETLSAKEHPLMTQGKSMMKSHFFTEAIKIFTQLMLNLQSPSHSKQSSTEKTLALTTQCHYLTGVCYFHLSQYDKVVQQLTQVIGFDQQYRKNVYLFLGIAYKKLLMIEEALLILGKALQIYPKYLDVLLLRAKILSKQKRFYDSVEDLNKCIKLDPQNIQAYVSKADCLRNLTQYKQAITIYTEVMKKEKQNFDILLKRAITYIENQEIQSALNDLNQIIHYQPKNSEAYLFKGLAFTKNKNYHESVLSYQQAIKFNSSKKATTKALYEISKLKIQIGDFYGAAYTLQRGSSLDIDMKVTEKLKIFVDGATFIMKKKYRKGIELLHILGKKQHLNEMIRSLLYSFRAYGHFCMNKYASALSDLKQLVKCGFALDSASEYNMTLLEGIIKCQNNQFAEAMDKFCSASELRKQFGDPDMFQALTKISQYNRTPKLRQKNTHLLNEALEFINRAIQKQQNFNYFYLLALILYILKDYKLALTQLQYAIEGSDMHILKHFYLRAMIHAMQQKYQECYTDLNNVLSISKQLKQKDQKEENSKISFNGQNNQKEKFHGQFEDMLNQEKEILQVYLNRAKCYLLFGEKKKAFQDLQTYIGQKPMDNSIHLIAGKLLFSIGAHEDAIKAFSYSPNVEKNKDALLSRIKCYIYLKQLNLALKDMEKLLEFGDKNIEFDYCCLSALKQASKGDEENMRIALHKITNGETFQNKNGVVFSLSDLFFYKGMFYFMVGEYENAKKFITKSKNLKKINNELEVYTVHKDLNSEDQDKIFQNRIFTDKQIDYNIGLCQLKLGNLAKAADYLKIYKEFQFIFDPKKVTIYDQPIMTPFPTNNRLCSIFPEIQYSVNKKFRLSFDLPSVHSPAIEFETEYKLIQEVSMSSIESRPDAPWIKRNKFGVVFTTSEQHLRIDDIDIKTERSHDDSKQNVEVIEKNPQNDSLNINNQRIQNEKENQLKWNSKRYLKQNSHKLEQENYEIIVNRNNEDFDDDQNERKEVQKTQRKQQLKQMLELDVSIQAKLKRIIKQEKKD